jgi:phosphomannomutase
MYGSARGYIASVLDKLSIPYITVRHGVNPYFGGHGPEPIRPYLTPLKAVLMAERGRIKGERLLVGVVTDGDGDRVAAMDGEGNYVDPHRCFALLLEHLWSARGWRGKVVKSFTLSDMASKLSERLGAPIDEVPVGFKYVSEKLLTEDVLIGGEESGGIAVKHHIPERDGVLMALLLLELVAEQRRPLSEIIEGLMERIGHHYYERRDLHLEERKEVVERLKEAQPKAFAGKPVCKIETLDGVKLRFEDGWLLFRASGTEPLLRIYCELDDPTEVQRVLDQAERFAKGELALL